MKLIERFSSGLKLLRASVIIRLLQATAVIKLLRASDLIKLLRASDLIKLLRASAVALMLSAIFTLAPAMAAESDFSQPIDVSADRSEYNQKTGKQVLSGNVEIRQGSMLIRADTINVILKDNKLSVIEGQGNPIAFQQQNEAGEMVTGSCDAINYDAVNGILTMTGNAELKQPKQQLKSDSIVFNSINQSVVAQGGESGRVSITIQPPDRK